MYMATLVELNNDCTDKNTVHSYLPIYDDLLKDKRETAKYVLEVGIDRGGSIKLWHDYFTNATVYGLDNRTDEIVHAREILDPARGERVKLLFSSDAYDETFFQEKFVDTNMKFDMVLDDGPHTLESMQTFIKLYSQILTDDGILIVEDVYEWDWIEKLSEAVPDDLKDFVYIHDLRANKGRYDDILFIIDKRNRAQ